MKDWCAECSFDSVNWLPPCRGCKVSRGPGGVEHQPTHYRPKKIDDMLKGTSKKVDDTFRDILKSL